MHCEILACLFTSLFQNLRFDFELSSVNTRVAMRLNNASTQANICLLICDPLHKPPYHVTACSQSGQTKGMRKSTKFSQPCAHFTIKLISKKTLKKL